MTELTIEVCSREEAGAILSAPSKRADVCFLVSIGEPHDRPPAGFGSIRERLRLHFADTTDDTGPLQSHVEQIIAAASPLRQRSGRVIVHCQAGISRSSAAAIILYRVLLGEGSEREAVRRVMQQRPIAQPNQRMIDLADELLGCNGALIDAVNAAI